ncbi:uncharacterized protein [Antedon mediterranea]|uniref:uncharacterized protein n=1 Tax=Antedon mediterranea TaxID=105859 RepID=UPI003AF6F380
METYRYLYRFPMILILVGLVVGVNSQFLIDPQSAEVTQGADHGLECVVNRTYLAGYYFVAWTKDSEVFSARNQIDKVALENINGEDPEDRYTITKIDQGNTGTYKLIIDSVKGVDSGNYQCVICQHPPTSYECTAITDFKSTVATLNVLYTPSVPEYPECTGLDSSATVSVGTQVEVTCVSEIGDPKVQLQWHKDGVPLSSTITEREDNNRLYLIYTFTAELSHTGMVLSCSSTSSYFTSYSESCRFNALNVVDMPVVAATSGAAEDEEGSQTTPVSEYSSDSCAAAINKSIKCLQIFGKFLEGN